MGIFAAMEKRNLPKPAQIRTSPEIQNAFKVAVQRLALSRVARIHGRPPTMEASTAALWLFFASLDRPEAEAFLAEWFPRVEKLMGEDAGRRGGEETPGAEAGSGRADEATTLPAEGIEGRPAKKPNPRRKRAR